MEIYVEGHSIVLKKVEENCIFCGKSKDLINYKDKLICKKCLSELFDKTKTDEN